MPTNDSGQILYGTAVKGERVLTILGEATKDKAKAEQQFKDDKVEFADQKLQFAEIKPGISYEIASIATESLH